MHRRAVPNRSHLSALACLILLNACGGGGSGGSTTQDSSGSSPSAPGATFALSGVAATGAPLPGASIRVVDASGAAVGLVDSAGNTLAAGTTNLTDGSYSLLLNTASPKVPLLIEASGFDVSGNPVVLHSTLQAASTPAVANITPATEAVVAQVLGADPKTVFQKASDYTSAIATLGNATALTAASDNLKTIIAANLTDGKVASAKDLDFFKDSSFVANKSGVDGTIEGLRIQVARDSSGKDQLLISNKLITPGTTEVAIDLASARTELSNSSGTVANAITSAAKKTTSASTSAAHLDVLDDLVVTLNKLIAQGSNSAAFAPIVSATPAPSSAVITPSGPVNYSYFGRTKTALQSKLTGYAAKNYQLSKLQVTGCVEDPVSAKGCAYIGVSANVTDSSGKLIEVFSDGVFYSKDTTPKWLLAGNGRATEIGVFPAGVASFSADGTPLSDPLNPNFGIQIAVRAQDDTGAKSVSTALVQLPNGHTVNMAYCNQLLLCLTASSSATPVSTGELKDSLLQQPTINWIGTQDTTAGAKYAITYVIPNGNAAHKGNAYLASGLATDIPVSTFPVPDGIKTTPLTGTALLTGPTFSWNNWAAANPKFKLISARIIVTGSGTTAPVITDAVPTVGTAPTVKFATIKLASNFTATGYQLWLTAQDAAGRRLYSKFAVAP